MNTPSIGCAFSFFNEHNALPGFLEAATQFFDDILAVDCSPGMVPSSDGSREILEQWGFKDIPLWDLSNGFGHVRNQLIHTSKTDYTVILDCDERLRVCMPVLKCEGTDRYPAQPNPDLKVSVVQSCYNQKELLIQKIQEAERRGIQCVRFQRAHFFDLTDRRPCENWSTIKDYQLRCMKSRSDVGFKTFPKIHEAAVDRRTGQSPEYVADDPLLGPVISHYHCWYKRFEPEQRAEDIKNYDALHRSDTHTPIPK